MKRRRRNNGKDRISGLPDCLLLEILSNLEVYQAVQLSILSTRWKNLWKHISVLSMHYRNYKSIESFASFVSQFFSLRNHKTSVQALTFDCRFYFDPKQLKRIIKYLFSHNVQRLDMTVACSLQHFPLCTNFSYHTLTSLKLTSCLESTKWGQDSTRPVFPISLQFPALTYLYLRFFTFRITTDDGYADPFSQFQSLDTLIITHCPLYNEKTGVENSLIISSVSLVNLKIKLPMDFRSYKFKLSTPNLCSFDFTGHPFQNLCGHNNISNTNFSSIKHVKMSLPARPLKSTNVPSILLNWLLELAFIESFTIISNTLKILNEIPDSWKIDFPYLHNLKLLKIKASPYFPLPDGSEDFLLQNAPSAKKVIFPGPTLNDLINKELELEKQFRLHRQLRRRHRQQRRQQQRH